MIDITDYVRDDMNRNNGVVEEWIYRHGSRGQYQNYLGIDTAGRYYFCQIFHDDLQEFSFMEEDEHKKMLKEVPWIKIKENGKTIEKEDD